MENVLYFSQYIVTDPGDCRDLAKYQCLTEGEYNDMREKYENDFEAGMGAEAIKKLLAEIDLDALSASLKEELENCIGSEESQDSLKDLMLLKASECRATVPSG